MPVESGENTMRRSVGWGCYFLIPLVVCVLGHPDVFALTASIGPDGCNAQALHALGITGQGVGVGMVTLKHCLYTHEAFHDKDENGYPIGDSHAHTIDATGDTVSPYEPFWHDTAMVGIVGSRGGRLWPAEIGVAPDAEIYSVKVTKAVSATDPNRLISSEWIQTGLDELYNQGCRVVVTGIQLTSFTADGSSQYSLIYDYYANTYDMIFINAAGNDASKVTVFGDGFNGITTAGLITTTDPNVYVQVGTASNPGPTVDGRHKPEIAAPARNLWVPTSSSDTAWTTQGTTRGETSWAGPHAAGVAALLVGYANGTTEADDGKSVVIKAAMVNTTFPNIRTRHKPPTEISVETTGQLWNAQRGYGRVDALRAYNVLREPKVTAGTDITQSAGWVYQTIGSLGQNTYRIYGYKNERLALTMTWHRAVTFNGSTYADEPTPKLNLDLSISDPNGNSMFSETYDPSHPNNLRKADVLLPRNGFYEVHVTNTTTQAGRYYGMAFELLEPLEGDFNIDYVVDTSDLTAMALYWLTDGCTGTEQACYWLDLTADGKIDLVDMAIFSADWLTTDPRYYSAP